VAFQAQQRAGYETRSRVYGGHEEDEDQAAGLVSKALAAYVCRNDLADEVFPGPFSPFGYRLLDVVLHLLGALYGRLGKLRFANSTLHGSAVPLVDHRQVLDREADELGTHPEGQRVGELRHEICPPALDKRVDESLYQSPYFRLQCPNVLRRESFRSLNQVAEFVMTGRSIFRMSPSPIMTSP